MRSSNENRIFFTIATVTHNLIENNRVATFDRLVRSLKNQRFRDFEHIIYDGDSKDGTIEMLDEICQRSPFSTYISEPDRGIYHAMNKSANIANGQFLLFLNSDDFYHNEFGLEELASTINKHKYDYCYSPINIVDNNGAHVEVMKCQPKKILIKIPFGHPGFVIRKSLFDSFGGFDERYSIASDYDLIFKAISSNANGGEHPVSFASFQLGGVSANIDACREQIIEIQLSHLGKFASVDGETMRKSRARGCLPLSLLLKIAMSNKANTKLKKIAIGRIPRAIRL